MNVICEYNLIALTIVSLEYTGWTIIDPSFLYSVLYVANKCHWTLLVKWIVLVTIHIQELLAIHENSKYILKMIPHFLNIHSQWVTHSTWTYDHCLTSKRLFDCWNKRHLIIENRLLDGKNNSFNKNTSKYDVTVSTINNYWVIESFYE